MLYSNRIALAITIAVAVTGQAGEPSAPDRALLVAVGQRDLKLIKSLVAKGANPDAEFVDHAEQMEEPICDPGMLLTPLISAARSADADVVRTLLTLGANPNHKGRSGETALLWAVADSHPDVMRVLLARGAMPNDSAYKGEPLLAIAARGTSSRSIEPIALLVSKGANVNAQDREGRTALMAATNDLQAERVKFLIRKHAALNTQDHRGRTALMSATMIGSKATVSALLAARSDVNIHDKEGWTALSLAKYALAHGGPLEGGMIFDGRIEGRRDMVTELNRAAKSQYGGIMRILLKHGAKSSLAPKP
jgi:serine/threonine-protein phosphatase 6 regulatory ankyrin repeat subunit B